MSKHLQQLFPQLLENIEKKNGTTLEGSNDQNNINFKTLSEFINKVGVETFREVTKTEEGSRFVISLTFTEKYLQEVNNQILDTQSQFMQLNQGWSETLARFCYELKQ